VPRFLRLLAGHNKAPAENERKEGRSGYKRAPNTGNGDEQVADRDRGEDYQQLAVEMQSQRAHPGANMLCSGDSRYREQECADQEMFNMELPLFLQRRGGVDPFAKQR